MRIEPNNPESEWTRTAAVIGALIMTALVGFWALSTQMGQHLLEGWKLIPTPDRFTELYFDNNLALPTKVTSGPTAFEFGVRNDEGETITYPYTVSLIVPGRATRVLRQGDITLASGGASNMHESISIPAGTTSAEISVQLPMQQQEIHFWLGNKS